ncbi:SMC family ATPase [Streptomyces benahoarensis]|nr:SMC family ATPase [Streptomyces benahoarensis]TSB32712.1 SMC family ATPase [Streptomyces benahoarensis]
MRLHRLSVTAFGPFGGAQTVDFDRLSRDGLFLLHGPTGAGKTSVLDAVCFALYGSVPGVRQAGQALRSDLADPWTPTEVVLELTVAGRRLEITRLPEQTRPKKRGTGTTREKAQSRLREYAPGPGEGGRWKALSRSHQEIGEEIGGLLGLNKEQFCQVVLLPQGDFARFLRADAESRARLLGRLFDTRRFAAVEERLAARRKAAAERVRGGDERLLALAHRAAEAAGECPDLAALPALPAGSAAGIIPAARKPGTAGRRPAAETVPDAPGVGEPGFAASVLVRMAVARVAARERLALATCAERSAGEAERAAALAWEEAQERDRVRRRLAEARDRAARLAGTAATDARDRERLAAAGRAAEVAPTLAWCATARREAEAADATERARRAELPASLAGAEPDHLAAREHAEREQLGALAAARRAEERVAALAAEREASEREGAADEDAVAECAEWLDGWDARRRALQERVESAQEAVGRAEALEAAVATARERAAASRRRDELAARLERLRGESLAARERSAAAHERWLELKDRRLRGVAAELAAALRDGAPCAVCGATAHPDPAQPGEGHVGRAEEEAALAAYQEREDAYRAAEGRVREVHGELSAATAAAGDAPAAERAARVEELAAEYAEVWTVAAGVRAAREALTAAEREAERRRTERQDAERRIAARLSRREALEAERAALREEVARARGECASVAERARRGERRAAMLAAVVDAAGAARTADRRLREAEEARAEAVASAGFADVAQAVAAQLPDAVRRELAERVAHREAEAAAAERELADAEAAAAVATGAEVDPAAARRSVEAAGRRLREAAAVRTGAQERCAALDRLSHRATAEARQLAPLYAEFGVVGGVASLVAGVSGENVRRMRLESYVLAARLEQVAVVAGERLQRMSGGRYTLVHTDARSAGSRRSGLGLRVIDAWTGRERDTSSLSGGETFYASLALALGLADVVTDEAGGTRLDTLFIDEGFGSLDEQSLDEVLDVLDGLRERDRSVGIVSHVADLKGRIPAQLEVLKDRSGSAVRHRGVGG